jgi:hypothetical protein
MAGVWFTNAQDRPTEFLDLTSLTLDEFEQLVEPFEDAFQTHMARWRLDGKLRTARQFAVPGKDGIWCDDLGDIFQGFLPELFADLGQGLAFGV